MQQPAEQDLPSHSEFPGIFVLSLPRTGSTVLRLLLDTHPDVFCPDELNLGRLLRALYDTNEGLAEGRGTLALDPALIDPESPGAAATRSLVVELMGAAAARKGKSLWCDKSPSNLETLPLIFRLLPGARYIVLHRHCLDVASSCLRFSTYGFFLTVVEDYVRRDHRNFLRAMIRAWVEKTEELLAFEREHAGSCHRLRYEDLVTSTEEAVRGLGEFLGVPFDPRLVERVFSSPHHQRALNGDPNALYSRSIVGHSIGSGAALPPAAFASIPRGLLGRMNRLLETLGYPAAEITASGVDLRLGAGAAGAAGTAGAAGAGSAGETGEDRATPPRLPVGVIFSMLGQRLGAAPHLSSQIRTSFKFVLTGEGGGTWVLDLTEPPGRLIPDGQEARCVITASAGDFAEIVAGRLNPAAAARQGRMRIEGEVDEGALRGLVGALVAG